MFKSIIVISCLIGLALGKSCASKGCGNNSKYQCKNFRSIPLPGGPGQVLDAPYYDCKTRSLYFVDLFAIKLYRYSEDDDRVYGTQIDGFQSWSFIIPTRQGNGNFVCGGGDSNGNAVYLIYWDGVSPQATVVRKLFELAPGRHTNHAFAGPKGALYVGEFSRSGLCGGPTEQHFYRYHKGKLEELNGEFETTNSLGGYENKIIHLDGCGPTYSEYSIDKYGKVSGPKEMITIDGIPSDVALVGAAVNQKKHAIGATYGSGKIYVTDLKNKQVISTVKMPVKYMSATAFGGGKSLDLLYILSAQMKADILTGLPTNETQPAPSGSILVCEGFGKGIPVPKPCISCGN